MPVNRTCPDTVQHKGSLAGLRRTYGRCEQYRQIPEGVIVLNYSQSMKIRHFDERIFLYAAFSGRHKAAYSIKFHKSHIFGCSCNNILTVNPRCVILFKITESGELSMSYIFSSLKQSDQWAQKQYRTLLSQAELPVDQPADFVLGIYDQEYNMIAAGSLLDNQLHSIVVDSAHRGRGILNLIVTHLSEYRFYNGSGDLCVTVQTELVPMFKSLGFHEIRRLCAETVFMGNRQALNQYRSLQKSFPAQAIGN